jgi:hypothetical protein
MPCPHRCQGHRRTDTETRNKKIPTILHKAANRCDINISTRKNGTMTRHNAPVEFLESQEIKPIFLTLLLLARYGAIFSGIMALSQCYPNVPVNNELDLKVKSLILQGLDESEAERRITIQSLLALTDYLPKSKTKERIDIGLQLHYDEAVKDTDKYMIKNLDKFPERHNLDINNASPSEVCQCFVRWYNLNIKSDCIDVWRRYKRIRFIDLDAPSSQENATSKEETIADSKPQIPIDEIEQKERFQQLKAYFETDPEQRLRNCATRKYPSCNCWELIKRRILTSPPQTFKEIKQDLSIPLDNITRLWYNKCVPLLAKIAQEIGYEIDANKLQEIEEE